MNAIVGLTAIAGANIESQDRVIECLSKITESSRHLLGLINEVLDMARIESGKMTLAQEEEITLPLYELELRTGVSISPMIVLKKLWDNRPFKTPFYVNIINEGIVL